MVIRYEIFCLLSYSTGSDRVLEDIKSGGELVIGHNERSQEADDVVVRSGALNHQAMLYAFLNDGRSQCRCRLFRCFAGDKFFSGQFEN